LSDGFKSQIDTRIGRNETNYLGRCTIGWAILNGSDPSLVVARSATALAAPTMPWEATACRGQGGTLNNSTETCQTPYVIFATGLKPMGNDTFMVIYGGGDSDTGGIVFKVDINGQQSS
jgi:predicted GH43/DUF377 family glycosyl hydrolase